MLDWAYEMTWSEFLEKFFHELEFISFYHRNWQIKVFCKQMYEMKLIVTTASIIY